ncbi:hypothetical protein TSAR_008554 [Trichomalopsis sarcophagae]|uniref:Uncharacterized protein n=1 Tax=Trichomalopsis sarcophagae TaxID=543379 RepID=A0A232EFJ5_9HYME|nr:hypothetical protein TSAR_008554 [Trichomalopsis sarcophagae]
MNKVGVFCLKKHQSLILFTEETFKNCKAILQIGVKYKLAHENVSFTSRPRQIECYHIACYRKFTALSKKYRQELRQTASCTVVPQEETEQPAGPSCSETRDSATTNETERTAEIVEAICSQARRTFDAITPDLRPYPKKPKLIEILPKLPVEATSTIPSSTKTHGTIPLTWVLSHALHIQNTPMWVGFNSLVFTDNSHFNRCKRIHLMINLALTILHFESFAQSENIEVSEEVKNYLVTFLKNRSMVPTIDNIDLLRIIESYEQYSIKTLNGEHGKTAQYYMIYINLINNYLMLTASIRTNDFELFKFMLPRITNLFFVFNQPNYARWLVLYHNKLCRVNETHPGLIVQLEKGSFGVKRTDNKFSKIPVDLTLEQTINADAASRLTGVLHFTNSVQARQRWCKSHSMRSTIITHVLQQTGIRLNQDITAELEKNRTKKSAAQLQSLIHAIKQNINPFDRSFDPNFLFNICSESIRFEARIVTNKVATFADSLKKTIEQSIDFEKVLPYPLTPITFAWCHLDGTHCKTDKSALMKSLEISIDSEVPAYTDVVLIDGFFFLHLMKDVPLTFENISIKLLQSIVKFNAKNIAIIFDRYFSPSIKDCEHAFRDTSENRDSNISGHDKKCSTDFSKELRNIKFKEAFVKFLINHWANDELAPYLGIKTVQLNYDHCYQYTVNDGRINRISHTRRQTKIIFHACNIVKNSNILIRCSNTDILVIMLGNMEKLSSASKI